MSNKYKYITWDLNFAQTRRNLITFEEHMGRENFFVNRNSNVCFPHDKLGPGKAGMYDRDRIENVAFLSMPFIRKGKMDFDTRELIPVPNSKDENLEKSKKLANVNLKLPWKTLDCRHAGHVPSSRF